MNTLKKYLYIILFMASVPLLIVFSAYIESKWFPVIWVEAVNISHTVTDNISSVTFQIHGHKYRACPLVSINTRWSIDNKISKDDVLYKDNGEIYTFPLNVKKDIEFTTVPLTAKWTGIIPNNSKLIIHYEYHCHSIYNNELNLIIDVPPSEPKL